MQLRAPDINNSSRKAIYVGFLHDAFARCIGGSCSTTPQRRFCPGPYDNYYETNCVCIDNNCFPQRDVNGYPADMDGWNIRMEVELKWGGSLSAPCSAVNGSCPYSWTSAPNVRAVAQARAPLTCSFVRADGCLHERCDHRLQQPSLRRPDQLQLGRRLLLGQRQGGLQLRMIALQGQLV